MNLFDAAAPEEARRRNQKKDGSVVKNLERLSRLVEPTEAVYTMDGELRKERHLDDLEDNSSLLEGETPVIKAKPRMRKRALTAATGNVPRLVETKPRGRKSRATRRDWEHNGLAAAVRIPNSTTHPVEPLKTRWSPTEDETMEFRYAVGNMAHHRRPGNFALFNDNNAAFSPSMSSYPGQHMPMNQTYATPMPQRLMMPSQPWLQPQNQNPLFMQDKYTYSTMLSDFPDLRGLGHSHENLMTMGTRVDSHSTNPLAWNHHMAATSTTSHRSDMAYGTTSGYITAASHLADPFGYSRNPLADTFEHFEAAHGEDLMNSDGKTSEDTTSGSSLQDLTSIPATGE